MIQFLFARRVAVLGLVLFNVGVHAASDLPAMLRERLASVVAVEFTIEHELDRTVNFAFGILIDDEGTVILEPSAISDRATPNQLKDFKVYRPGVPVTEYAAAEYLGQDGYSTWHFIRIEPTGRIGLNPITTYVSGEQPVVPALAEEVWGIGLRGKDEDFSPYFLSSRVSFLQDMPQPSAVALASVSGRGLPVFNLHGEFVGMGASGFGESMVIYSQRRRGEMSVLIDPDECAAFRLASEVVVAMDRIPTSPFGRPLPWFGVDGIDPVDPEVAEFLGLGSGTGLVISEVLAKSPAEVGGLLARDIIIALDGVPLPRLKPDRVVAAYLQRELLRRLPGTSLSLTVLRDKQKLELPIELANAPKTPAEAERHYFDDMGLTVREVVYTDAVARRADPTQLSGVVAHFVKPSSPVGTAGLQQDDWIKEIDGSVVTNFSDALTLIDAVEKSNRPEVVILVSRGGETSVLRIKLN
jgi:serine protease Do